MTEETLERRTSAISEAGANAEIHSPKPVTAEVPAQESAPSSDNASAPEFNELKKKSLGGSGHSGDLKRLHEVQVTVAAELGRTKVPIQELLKLTEGSVFELNRNISSPVELLAQGVPLGNGEVVVVDDQFAIRILEIYAKP